MKKLIASGDLATGEHITHGGKRPHSGRKAIDPDGTITITARLTAEQKLAYDFIGAARWLRHQLQNIIENGAKP